MLTVLYKYARFIHRTHQRKCQRLEKVFYGNVQIKYKNKNITKYSELKLMKRLKGCFLFKNE